MLSNAFQCDLAPRKNKEILAGTGENRERASVPHGVVDLWKRILVFFFALVRDVLTRPSTSAPLALTQTTTHRRVSSRPWRRPLASAFAPAAVALL